MFYGCHLSHQVQPLAAGERNRDIQPERRLKIQSLLHVLLLHPVQALSAGGLVGIIIFVAVKGFSQAETTFGRTRGHSGEMVGEEIYGHEVGPAGSDRRYRDFANQTVWKDPFHVRRI
jgi:hypothetical protein